ANAFHIGGFIAVHQRGIAWGFLTRHPIGLARSGVEPIWRDLDFIMRRAPFGSCFASATTGTERAIVVHPRGPDATRRDSNLEDAIGSRAAFGDRCGRGPAIAFEAGEKALPAAVARRGHRGLPPGWRAPGSAAISLPAEPRRTHRQRRCGGNKCHSCRCGSCPRPRRGYPWNR